jgi:transcriptional regulator with PAS, ATPase and Fis domain
MASEGTFFLDEIGNATSHIQAKLLDVIENKKYRRLGDTSIKKINVRFIFATNKNLKNLINEGKFRRDLFFRINTVSFHLPPLRERKEDIPLLVNYFLEKEHKNHGRRIKITPSTLNKLLKYDFPGNIRELESIVQRAIIFSDNNVIKNIEPTFNYVDTSNNDSADKLFNKMVKEKNSFWDVLYRPYLKRELNREEVKKILYKGMIKSNGSYKKVMFLFNAGSNEKEYKRFMKVLYTHNLQVK